MKITTIEQALDLAEALNKVYDATNVATHDVTIHGIESEDDLEQLARQENGNFFSFDNYFCCSVRLGKVDFILTSKNK